MRLLKAIAKTLGFIVLVCVGGAAIFGWTTFWYGYFKGEWRGLIATMAPVIIWCVVSLTWMFYKEEQG